MILMHMILLLERALDANCSRRRAARRTKLDARPRACKRRCTRDATLFRVLEPFALSQLDQYECFSLANGGGQQRKQASAHSNRYFALAARLTVCAGAFRRKATGTHCSRQARPPQEEQERRRDSTPKTRPRASARRASACYCTTCTHTVERVYQIRRNRARPQPSTFANLSDTVRAIAIGRAVATDVFASMIFFMLCVFCCT